MSRQNYSPHILIVEDNPGDAQLMSTAIREEGITEKISLFKSGEEFLNFLDTAVSSSDPRTKYLVLLDLNLPGKNGHEILEDLKANHQTGQFPVVVLTGSRQEEDVMACSKLDANGFVIKPKEWNQYLETAKYIGDVWHRLEVLPPIWVNPSQTEILQHLDVTEVTLTQAQQYLERAAALLSPTHPADWAKVLLLALNIQAAWVAIREHWQKVCSTHGLYNDIEFEAPRLASRVRALEGRLKTLEAAVSRLAEKLASISGKKNACLDSIRTELEEVLNSVQATISQEISLEYAAIAEPPALD